MSIIEDFKKGVVSKRITFETVYRSEGPSKLPPVSVKSQGEKQKSVRKSGAVLLSYEGRRKGSSGWTLGGYGEKSCSKLKKPAVRTQGGGEKGERGKFTKEGSAVLNLRWGEPSQRNPPP